MCDGCPYKSARDLCPCPCDERTRIATFPGGRALERRPLGSPRYIISCNECGHTVRKALPPDPKLRAMRLFGVVTAVVGGGMIGGGLLSIRYAPEDLFLWAFLLIVGTAVAVAGVNGLIFGLSSPGETEVRLG